MYLLCKTYLMKRFTFLSDRGVSFFWGCLERTYAEFFLLTLTVWRGYKCSDGFKE